MKSLRYLLIIPALLLGACNGTSSSEESTVVSSETSTATSESISSEVPTSSSISSETSFTSSSSSTSSSSEEVINPLVANSKWGLEAAQACYDTIGTVIPYMEADAFEYKVTVDEYGDAAIWFYLYYETQEIAEAKVIDYAYAAWEQDSYECVVKPTWLHDENYSMWQQNILYADKVLTNINAVEIMGLDSIKNYNDKAMGCLGLYCFNYIPNVDPHSFPTYAVDYYTNDEVVPEMTGDDLNFEFTFAIDEMSGDKFLQIYVTSDSHTYDMEEMYFYNILDSVYFIAQYDVYEEKFTDEFFVNGDEYPGWQENFAYLAYDYHNTHVIYIKYDTTHNWLYIEISMLTPSEGNE